MILFVAIKDRLYPPSQNTKHQIHTHKSYTCNIKVPLWKYGITDTVPTRTGYYGYNDTTEVVVELTHIFL